MAEWRRITTLPINVPETPTIVAGGRENTHAYSTASYALLAIATPHLGSLRPY